MMRAATAFALGWWLLWTGTVLGQDDDRSDGTTSSQRRIRIGVLGAGGVTIHGAAFSSLPELPTCCPRFRDGSGLTTAGILWGEYPAFGSVVLGLRMGLAQFAGTLRALERKPVLVDDTPTDAVIQHTLDAHFRSMRWEGYLGLRGSQLVDLYVGAGTDLVRQADASIREELVQPSAGTFENGRRVRNERSSALESSTRSMASLVAGARFSIPMGKSQQWWLIPELSFRYALDPVARQQQWYVYSVLVGVGLAYAPVELPRPTQQRLEPPREETLPPLAASLVAYGVAGAQEQLPLRVDVHPRRRILPLLPVLFVDGEEIPERYIVPASQEDTSWYAALHSPLGAYYALLPIVGSRLRTSTDTLTLVGIDSRSAPNARRRAEYIARYLQSVWSIPGKRLRIGGSVDERDTAPRVQLEGNRRLFGPVESEDTVRSMLPPTLRIRPATNGAELLRQWTIRVWQDSLEIARYSGSGGLPLKLDVDLSTFVDRLRPNVPLLVELEAISTRGTRAVAHEHVPLAVLESHQPNPERVAEVEVFYFPTALPTKEALSELAERYRSTVQECVIVAHGTMPGVTSAAERLAAMLTDAGFPPPRIEQEELLYHPSTPERVQYSQLLLLRIRYAVQD
jgi:hypothetical protein